MLPIESVDTRRLARAATLQVRQITDRTFEVTGGSADHLVIHPVGTSALGGAQQVWCDCEDFKAGRGTRACKHILAVALTLATDEDRAAVAHLLGIE